MSTEDPFLFEQLSPSEYSEHHVPSQNPDGSVRWRQVWAPSQETTIMQRDLLETLYGANVEMPYSFGAMPGVSLADNVIAHREGRHFYMVDFKDAFPSVDLQKLSMILSDEIFGHNLPGEVYDFLLNHFTVGENQNGLILGPPASPYLFNIYCKNLDEQLGEYSAQHGITYTRWIDDLTFSSPDGPVGKKKRAKIRALIDDYGFDISHKKSKVHSLDQGPVTITGLSLYPDGLFSMSPGLVNKIIEAMDGVEAKILGIGDEAPDYEDLGLLDGYNSVLQLAKDPDRAVQTRLEQELRERYLYLRRQLGARGIGSQVQTPVSLEL